MARNAPKLEQQTVPPAPMRGGSSGMPPSLETAAYGLTAGVPTQGAQNPFAARPEPKLRKYRVTGGPPRKMASSSVVGGKTVVGATYSDGDIQIVYEGVPCRIKAGREFFENQMDVDLLRRQGVSLEEITEPAKEEAKAEEPAA